jgi:hypothetical protein
LNGSFHERRRLILLELLVLCPINNFTEAFQLGEDRIGSGSPYERTPMEIVVDNIGVDLRDQLLDAAKRAAPDGLLGNQPNQRSTWLSQLAEVGV